MSRLTKTRERVKPCADVYAYEAAAYADATDVNTGSAGTKWAKYPGQANDLAKLDSRVDDEHQAARFKVWITTVGAGATMGLSAGPVGVAAGGTIGAVVGAGNSCTGVGCHISD